MIKEQLAPEDQVRSAEMYRKALVIRERAAALEPDNAAHAQSIAGDRFNLADGLYELGNYDESAALLRLASPVLAKQADDDVLARWASAMAHIGLAQAVAKTAHEAEAETLFACAENDLLSLAARGDNICIEFALFKLGVRRGEMYMQQAASPVLLADARRDRWGRAREVLTPAVARAEKINEMVRLEGALEASWRDGVAALAKADAAIAESPAGR